MRKKTDIAYRSRRARKQQKIRQNETAEQREARNEAQRVRIIKIRQNETEEARALRKEKSRLRASQLRALETPEQREARKEAQRLRMRKIRQNETPEEREARNEAQRVRMRELRQNETPEQREARNEAQRVRTRELRCARKEALIMLLKRQQIVNGSFSDCSQETRVRRNKSSVSSTRKNNRKISKENKRISDFSQNTIIVDSFSVIKTEIVDPSEKNKGLIFQDNSHYWTAADSMPAVHSPRINEEFILPDIKIEPES